MTTSHRIRRTATTIAAGMLVALPLTACSQDDGAVDTDDAVETTDEDQDEPDEGLDPATLSFEDISDDLAGRVGEEVMVEAKVEDVVTPGVFTVNALEGNDLESIVVVGAEASEDVEVDSPIVFTGTVRESLQPNQVEELLDVQLDDELLTEHEGQPYVEVEVIHDGAA